MIHLDTSFLIRALVPETPEDTKLREWLTGNVTLGISSISWAEFLCGPVGERDVELASRIVQEPAPLDAEDAAHAATLFNLGGRRRGSLVDCMIAAVALRAQASLATANPSDFRKLQSAGLHMVTM